MGKSLDQAPCAGASGQAASLDVAKRLHRQLDMVLVLGLLDLGEEQPLRSAGAQLDGCSSTGDSTASELSKLVTVDSTKLR
ncbi:hypothetical protein [Streptomyces parvus]|uniref:hypothetical protein n=1 Tax=Streptomyces parvus TaxID=66428 RepID=UPI00381302B0